MRKVGVAETDQDEWIEQKISVYADHLERCRRDFDNIAGQRGDSEAIKSPHAQGIAQYDHVVNVLGELLDERAEDKYKSALLKYAREAVSVLRDGNYPVWRRLAAATILEVLSDIPG